jgi:dTDP-glucose 4,6-dehydratase
MTRILLTGAGGFVGHHTLEHLLEHTTWDVVCTDSFRHRGKTDRIAQVLDGHPHWRPRVRVLTHDLNAPFSEQSVARMGHITYVIAMASESHVARSIEDPVPFVLNNVNVILNTLELCRSVQPERVIVISTDEVYGPEVNGKPHPEWDTILPSNPYSASKAAQEAIAIAYWRSFGVPVQIVNCMNLVGERQDPEKFLPMLIKRIASGQRVEIHGSAGDIGTRHYLHARNLADGILFLLQNVPAARWYAHATGAKGEVLGQGPDRFNIVGPDRIDNLELAKMVAEITGRPLHYELVDFHTHQPGHDPHYGLDPGKMTAAGWTPPVPFRESLERTVRWSLARPEWLL